MPDTWRQQLSSAIEGVLGLFYPNTCQKCFSERATAREGYIGPSCRSAAGAIKWIEEPFCRQCGLPFEGEISEEFQCAFCREKPPAFNSARAAVAMSDLVRHVILRYKYNRALWFEPFLTELLIERAVPALRGENWDIIVPVPLYPTRQREREFNQAERLAAPLAAALGLPLHSRLLKRLRPTQPQALLDPVRRTENVAQAFAYAPRVDLARQRVLLIDDVLTTGATTSACAVELLKHGAESVGVWTVARGGLRR